MLVVETDRYLVREVEETDFEDIKKLLKTNEYLSELWDVMSTSEDRLAEKIKYLYMRRDSYYVFDKDNGKFCGHISLMNDGYEGELSVRMMDEVDIQMIMSLFGEVLKKNGPKGHKNFTIQYNYE